MKLNDIVAGMICVYTDDDHGFGNRYRVRVLESSVPTIIVESVLEIKSQAHLHNVGDRIISHCSLLEPIESAEPDFEEEPIMFD